MSVCSAVEKTNQKMFAKFARYIFAMPITMYENDF